MQEKLFRLFVIGLSCSSFLCNSDICPKVCSPCLINIISCSFGGLKEIPKDLHMDTKRVTLVGHSFTQSSLSRQNFSRFSKPKYSIEQLSIRRSNIDAIQSKAFFDLSGLDSLDLSENVLLNIDDRAFANLKLKYLRLDLIGDLRLSSNAFDDLLVASLSIKGSHLKTFPFSLVKPLSKDLRNLYLSNNQIRNLSPKFESLFRHLTVLDLHANPLLCSCELMWLSTTLRWRPKHLQGQLNSMSTLPSPKCDGPSYLKGESIDKVPESEFDCMAPKLDRVEIQFENVQKATLRCTAINYTKRAPINISWTYINDRDHFDRRFTRSNDHHEALISVRPRAVLDKFLCLLRSDSGNVSVRININWPHATTVKNGSLPQSTTSQDHRNFFLKEQYTLLELLGSVVGTFIVTMFLFVLLYRFYFYKSMKLKKQQMKRAGFASYEVEHYSDSQTYDIPQYPSLDPKTKIFRPIFTVPPRNQPLVDHTIHKIL